MLYAIVAVVAIILDQWVKYWVAANIALDTGAVTLIPGVCDLVNLHNNGVAFGFLSSVDPQTLLIAVTSVLVIAVIAAVATNFISGGLGRWSAVMIAAGGIGNCIDRIINGYVQDMFKITLPPFDNFAIFNVADIFITVFCILFILYILFGGKKKAADKAEFIDEEEEEEPEYRVEKPVREPKQPRKEKKPRYDEEYERYKAARAAEKVADPAPAPVSAPTHSSGDDPFAEWERANARIRREVEQAPAPAVVEPTVVARPVTVEKPAPAPVAAAPASSVDDLDLDAILAEFK